MVNKFFTMGAVLCCALSSVQADSWSKNSIWNDGRAEVALYDSEINISSQTIKFRETSIVAKEKMRTDTLVQADDSSKAKTIQVLRWNQSAHFQFDNIPYDLLTSVYVKQDEPQDVLKLSVGAQDWNGNTSKIFKVSDVKEKSGTLESHSYFDGEADFSVTLTLLPQDYFEDQLPLSLRDLNFKAGASEKIRLWSSLTTNHGIEPTVVEAVVTVTGEETVYTHAGALPSWKVSVVRAGKTNLYWFEKAMPHLLTKMETSSGSKRLLYGRARWTYWDRRLPRPNVLN